MQTGDRVQHTFNDLLYMLDVKSTKHTISTIDIYTCLNKEYINSFVNISLNNYLTIVQETRTSPHLPIGHYSPPSCKEIAPTVIHAGTQKVCKGTLPILKDHRH